MVSTRLRPQDINCVYAWNCDITSGDYYIRVVADDLYTTTSACSPNTLNVIPEYDDLTLLLAVALVAMAFAHIRRRERGKDR
ncbi:MAG: hypothetical protein J4203_07935 [Candidatus Diapherotrites archaeon]|uniref:Uncharacterized protein n=1 Tax=Candidatus Iainarchaeum sp. TaxID=3101447 RepID=A0A8T4LAL3_9ARCH|nr:hypothetical protein [Candidatus Diapherotrites archaeon]